jgi:hypothetical protein
VIDLACPEGEETMSRTYQFFHIIRLLLAAIVLLAPLTVARAQDAAEAGANPAEWGEESKAPGEPTVITDGSELAEMALPSSGEASEVLAEQL